MKTVLRITVGLMVLVSIAGAAIWIGGWGAKDATHPTLANADLPPVISISDFFASTSGEWGYTISPMGKYLSWNAVDRFAEVIRLKARGGGNTHTIRPQQGFSYFWAADDSALYLQQYEPDLQRWVNWRIDSADPTTQWQDATPRGFRHWHIFHRDASGKGPWLVASRDRNPSFVDIYSINPDGSGKELIGENTGDIINWSVDGQGLPYARIRKLGTTAEGAENATNTSDTNKGTATQQYQLQVPEDPEAGFNANAKWKSLLAFADIDGFAISGFQADGTLLAASSINRDKMALVAIDRDSGEQSVINTRTELDIRRQFSFATGHPNVHSVDMIEYAPGYRFYEGRTDLGKAVLRLLNAETNNLQINFLSATADGDQLTFAVSRDEDSWEYWLIDIEADKATKINDNQFAHHAKNLAETKPVSFAARDGLTIPALLTLPNGIPPKNLPMILVAHGGPASHDVWGYNHEKQFLANRGYAVLSVNFRGSTGYGRKFQEAGFRQFGRAMQDDLVDATKWAIEEGIADPNAIAIYGASYGGYAAMMGLARDPDLYAAGISVVGVTDFEYQMKNNPHTWGMTPELMERYFGSRTSATDLEEMRAHSPIAYVENIKAPVFLAHGIQDRVVDRAQSEAFEARLKEHGKDYESLYLEREGHGFRRWQSKVMFHTALETFLHQHLGGRTGGFDKAQLGAKFLN